MWKKALTRARRRTFLVDQGAADIGAAVTSPERA
jgi:hypothetical protein